MRDDYLFTDEMKHDFICHPTAYAPRFIDEGTVLSVIWFTKTDFKAECKYPDKGACNA